MRNYRLEVFPHDGETHDYAYRLVARNGETMLYSQGFRKENALRAARRFNKHFGGGQLEIRILNDQGHPVRKTR